jgi:hypothetical protein
VNWPRSSSRASLRFRPPGPPSGTPPSRSTPSAQRLHINVSRRFLEKLDRAKDALSHSKPGASMEEILEAGLDLVLERQAKRNGLVARPCETVRPSKPDRIPAHVKRAVWERAGGRCEYILESGERCGCTTRLEYDHVIPKARGGRSTVRNTRLVCDPHNDLAARLVFGDRWMDRYTRKRGRPNSAEESPPACVEAPSSRT